jgi:hypothetical protein
MEAVEEVTPVSSDGDSYRHEHQNDYARAD